MIPAVDSSSFHPSATQIRDAYAQGIRVWGLYLPGPGIYSGNSKADYDLLKAGGMRTIAFCSGWADPKQQKALGASWGVDFLCLDDEPGIRGDGAWAQPWLDACGSGLYMPYGATGAGFRGKRAPFFIMAAYQGQHPYRDPRATWLGPAPPVPHGWQWAGTVDAFGGVVDRLWLDDSLAALLGNKGEDLMTPEEHQWLMEVRGAVVDNNYGALGNLRPEIDQIRDTVTQLAAALAKLQSVPGPPGPAGAKGDPGPPPGAGTTFTAKIGG